jgi:hypothetical protein
VLDVLKYREEAPAYWKEHKASSFHFSVLISQIGSYGGSVAAAVWAAATATRRIDVFERP